MAAINFKEIPQANVSSGEQDTFELFARDFLSEIYKMKAISEPNRGADGGKDILFEEIQTGFLSENKTIWLVSCKHKAFSGQSVNEDDEKNISDRLVQHNATGFIGFYSTLPSSGLNNRLDSYKGHYKIEIFDNKKIEQNIINKNHFELFKRYFPISFKSWNESKAKKTPTKLLGEYLPLACAKCGKDLLKIENKGEAIIVFEHDDETDEVESVYCVCKGICDRYMSNKARVSNCYTSWDDLEDFLLPTIYLKKYMANLNILYEGRVKFTPQAFLEYKKAIIAISQLVLRDQSAEEYQRVLDLEQIPDWI